MHRIAVSCLNILGSVVPCTCVVHPFTILLHAACMRSRVFPPLLHHVSDWTKTIWTIHRQKTHKLQCSSSSGEWRNARCRSNAQVRAAARLHMLFHRCSIQRLHSAQLEGQWKRLCHHKVMVSTCPANTGWSSQRTARSMAVGKS